MDQFKAEAGKSYKDSAGRTYTTPAVLGDAEGWLSSDYKEYTPSLNLSSSSNDIVSSTDGIRSDEKVVVGDSIGLIGDINSNDNSLDAKLKELLDSDLYSQTDAGVQDLQSLNEMRNNLGMYSTEDQATIDAAGKAAEAEYQILIDEAEAEKKKGLPKSVIGAGERGGFMSTQFAGGAALQTTEGGDFMGEGGELNRIKSVYDLNISVLKAKAKVAIINAKEAAKQAIKTGKQEDYAAARQAYQDAQALSQDAISLATSKVNAIASVAEEKRAALASSNALINEKQQAAADKVNYYLENYGYEYISNNPDQITKLFKEAGYEDADIETITSVIKQKSEEAAAENLPQPELRTIGKNLYSVTYDKETKQFVTKLLASSGGSTSAGTGSGTGSSPSTGTTNLTDKQINAMLVNYPAAFKAYIKSIVPTANFEINSNSIANLYQQYKDMGSPDVANDDDEQVVQAEIAAITGSDGYVDPTKYGELRQRIAQQAPDKLKWFDATYPRSKMIKPASKSSSSNPFVKTN